MRISTRDLVDKRAYAFAQRNRKKGARVDAVNMYFTYKWLETLSDEDYIKTVENGFKVKKL